MTDAKKELADAIGEIIDAEFSAAAAAVEAAPPVLSTRFEKRMEKLIQTADSGRSVSKGVKARRIVLIAAAIVLALALAACAVPQVRAFIAGFFVRYMENHDEHTVQQAIHETIEAEYGLFPIMDGFREISVTRNEASVVTVYLGDDGDIIMLNQVSKLGFTQMLDNENGKFYERTIDGIYTKIYISDDSMQASWIKDGYYFSLTYSSSIEIEQFEKLIVSVRAK
ncbi:MAG: DUF4367 domain-containing protein [Clostridia bacterium]|nr:DUF4367 domain-containing protein [Clostridia bacterium]